MEKGFNDDELADIMNEIESLEQEFASDDSEAKAEPGIDEVAQSVAALAQEEEQEEVEPEMVQEPEFEEPEIVQEPEVEEEPEMVAEAYESEMVHEDEQPEDIAEPVVSEVESPVVSPVAGEHEVLEQLSDMKVEDIVPEKTPESYDDNIHHMKIEETPMSKPSHSPKSGHTSMNFSVEGDMKLDLSFMIGHNEVKLHVTDQGLEIELEGGAKFSLPVSVPVESKKVA